MAESPGDSIRIAREYMDSLCVESRLLGTFPPSALSPTPLQTPSSALFPASRHP